MSVNWVLLTSDGKDIVPLENEVIFFREQGVRLELDCSNGGYPGAGVSYASKSGILLLTNQRIVYLCADPTSHFATASLPINNIHDSKLVQSWFSAPVFKGVVMPIPRGGLSQPARLAITFPPKSMASYSIEFQQPQADELRRAHIKTCFILSIGSQTIHEFDVQYRSLRERLQESDGAAPQHLEQLPVYLPPEPSATEDVLSNPTSTTSAPTPQPEPYSVPYSVASSSNSATGPPLPQPLPQVQPNTTPSDLPPSYDELH
ncbi:hypothetical protein BGZ46_009856 [Entomortierella lignicola]|nr:hypothetical protein BGZ46_009856 [Entomortierella lignicola]